MYISAHTEIIKDCSSFQHKHIPFWGRAESYRHTPRTIKSCLTRKKSLVLSIYWFFKWATSWQNQQNGMCAQWRLRSAWASTQSDQSLRCPHEESFGPLSAQRRLWSDWADAQADLSLRWVHSHFFAFVMRRLKYACATIQWGQISGFLSEALSSSI